MSDFIGEADKNRIDEFVSCFLDRCTDIAVRVPEQMVAGESEDGWTPWKPVDSPVRESDIAALESEVGANFPPLFRAYLTHKCLLMTEFLVRLPETPFDDPLGQIRRLVQMWNMEPWLKAHHLLPFATDPDGAGPVCFDLTTRDTAGDCEVVVVDMGRLRYGGEIVRRIAPTFRALLDQIEAELISYDGVE